MKISGKWKLARRGTSLLLAAVLMMSAFAPGMAFAEEGDPAAAPVACTVCGQETCETTHVWCESHEAWDCQQTHTPAAQSEESSEVCQTCKADPCVCQTTQVCETCKADPCVCQTTQVCETCKADPCVCPATQVCETCKADPCVCPATQVCETCKADPCVCPATQVCETCKVDPCVCPAMQVCETCKADPCVCAPVCPGDDSCTIEGCENHPSVYDQTMAALSALSSEAKTLSASQDTLKAFHNRLMDVYVGAWENYDKGLLNDAQIEAVDAATVEIEQFLLDTFNFNPYADAAAYVNTYTVCYKDQQGLGGTYDCYWAEYEGQWCAKYFSNDDWVYNAWLKESDDTWYYIDQDGYMAVNQVVNIGGTYYYFTPSGAQRQPFGPINGTKASWSYYKNNDALYATKTNMTNVQSSSQIRPVGVEYSNVILGSQSAKSVESNATSLNSYCSQTFTEDATDPDLQIGWGCGLGDCDGARVFAKYDQVTVGTDGAVSTSTIDNYSEIASADGGKYMWIVYHNVAQDANGKPICLEMSIYDYAVGTDASATPRIGFTTTRGYDAAGGGEYVKDKAPGVSVTNIAWVTVEYKFYTHDGSADTAHNWNDVKHTSIAVKGSTSYYDVDGYQGVHLHGSSAGNIIATADSTLKCNTPSGPAAAASGPFVYCGIPGDNKAYTTTHAFTEEFSVAANSSMFRTFVFRNGGGIYHDADPVVTLNASVTKKVTSPATLDTAKAFTFTAELLYSGNKIRFPANTAITGANSVTKAPANQLSATFTLKHNQTATFTNLPAGSVLKVTETADGNYTTSNSPISITAGSSGTITNTRKVGSLTVKKEVSGYTGAGNYVITVTGEDGYSQTKTLTAAGSVTFENIPTGSVKVTEDTEKAEVDGYNLTVNGNSQTITISANQTATHTITNTYAKQTGSLKVTKQVTGYNSGNKTYSITVSGTGYNETQSIKAGETATFTNIPVGTVMVTENVNGAAVSNYSLQVTGSGQSVTITSGGAANHTITNAYTRDKGSLKVNKAVTGYSGSKSFSITVTGPDNYKETKQVNGNGNVVFTDIPTGQVTVTENVDGAQINGYTLTVTGNNATQTIKKGEQASVTITNAYTRDRGSLKVNKAVTGYSGSKSFSITVTGPDNYKETKTVEGNKYVVFENIPTGQVTVTENVDGAKIDGYTLTVTGGTTATIKKGEQAEVTITNTYTRDKGALTLKKNVAGITTGEKPEFKFQVTDADGSVQNITLDSSNSYTATVSNLATGTVTIQEQTPPGVTNYTFGTVTATGGTRVDDDTYQVQVTKGTEASAAVTYTNTYVRDTGKVTLQKIVDSSSAFDKNGRDYTFTMTLKDKNSSGTMADAKIPSGVQVKLGESWTAVPAETSYTFTLKGGQSAEFTGLPVGAQVIFKETSVENMTVNQQSYQATANVQSTPVTVVFTNTRANGSVQVTKIVDSSSPADLSAEYTFQAEYVDVDGTEKAFPGGVELTGAKSGNSDDLGGKAVYFFTVTHNTPATFSGLPIGSKVKITETKRNGEDLPQAVTVTYSATDQSASSGTTPGTLTVTNTRGTAEASVTKAVVSTSPVDRNRTYSFRAAFVDVDGVRKVFPDGVTVTIGEEETPVTANAESCEFSLKDGQTAVFSGLPMDSGILVMELDVPANITVTVDGQPVDEEGTVIHTEESATFTNTRQKAAVAVAKQVQSVISGYLTREFTFTAKFYDGETQLPFPEAVTADSRFTMSQENCIAQFTLKNGETVTFRDLYVGTRLVITETADADFTPSNTTVLTAGADGSRAEYVVTGEEEQSITYTNTLNTAAVTVEKEIIGEIVDEDQLFRFQASIYDPANPDVPLTFPRQGQLTTTSFLTRLLGLSEDIEITYNDDGTAAIFYLKHGQSVELVGIPLGAEFRITESEYENYTTWTTVGETTVKGRDAGLTVEAEGNSVHFANHRAVPAVVSLTATKTMDRKTPKDGAFTFKLMNEKGKVLEKVKNDGKAVIFTDLSFEKEGTYIYKITEVKGIRSSISYDQSVYTVKIVVTRDDDLGDYHAEVTYEKNGLSYKGIPKFSNFTKDKKNPGTGDVFRMGLWGGMLTLSAAALAAAAAIRTKKRKK